MAEEKILNDCRYLLDQLLFDDREIQSGFSPRILNSNGFQK